MEAVQVMCPSGLFPLPTRHDDAALPVALDPQTSQQPQQQQLQLLEQLQAYNLHADRLLKMLSVQREQGVRQLEQEIYGLYEDVFSCTQQTLQQAATSKQPLLLTSTQHTSCFCQLLERLHLVDVFLKAGLGNVQTRAVSGLLSPQQLPVQDGPDLDSQQLQLVQQVDALLGRSTSFISHLEQRLQTVPDIDGVLAALVQYCQQNMAAGTKLSTDFSSSNADSKGKAEVIDVACLSSLQEQHSAARALPLLMRLYFINCSRLETIAAGRPEPLSNKLLDKCLSQLAGKPVVPGYADVPLSLLGGLESCQGLAEAAAARKVKLPSGLPTDAKPLAKLNQSYSLQQRVVPLLQQHDLLCDLLSQLALEVRQSVAVDRDIDSKAFGDAEQLVVGSINFVTAAKNALVELHAWRCLQQQQEQGEQTQAIGAGWGDRFALQDGDVVPFIDVLGAVKGLTGLVTDSHSWLQQLLHVQTVKQLHDFAASTLPALAKQYPRNERIQQLLRSAMLSMQGQLVELKDDTANMCVTPSAVSSAPVTPTLEAMKGLEHPFHTLPGPVAEGFESLRPRWGKKARQSQQEPAEQAQQGDEEDGFHQMMAQAAVAAAEITAQAARVTGGGAVDESQQQPADEQQAELQQEEAVEPSNDGPVEDSAPVAAAAEDLDSFTAADPVAAALQLQPPQRHHGSKKRWGKGLMRSMRKGKHKPEPSPDPELCAAPAALAALEEMLSGAEAAYFESEAANAPDGAASSSTAAAPNLGARLRLNLSTLDEHSPGLGSANQSNFSSMTSLTAAFDQPPDLPWEKGGLNGEESPGSVAAAAAAFERLAAAKRTSRLATARSAPQAEILPAVAAATSTARAPSTGSPDTNLPALEAVDPSTAQDLDPEELAAAAALQLALGSDADLEAAPPDIEALSSPGTARKFHLFKFKSLLQHHEKLSTTGTSDLLPVAKANSTSKQPDEAAVAAVELGAVARMRAVLSMRRRTSAADQVAAATAALQDTAEADAAAAEGLDGVARGPSMAGTVDAAGMGSATPRVSQTDTADVPSNPQRAADADQPTKQGRVARIASRIVSFRPQLRELSQAHSADGGKGFKALNFTAKLKKAMDRRQAVAALVDGQTMLQLESPPPLACLLQLRVILEQLMHEIKTETKKHLMNQLQMAAAAAAGTAGVKPDASIVRPLKQVKTMIKAVHRMQLALDYVKQLNTAADMSSLWISEAYSSICAEVLQPGAVDAAPVAGRPDAIDAEAPAGAAQVLYNLLFEENSEMSLGSGPQSSPKSGNPSPAEQHQPSPLASPAGARQKASSAKAATSSFPEALLAACMNKLDHLTAELPLLALHIFWDARYMLQRCGLLDKCLELLKEQEEACMRLYIGSLVPQAYEHYKKIAAHQTVTQEVLSSCGAPALQPVLPIYLEALLREPCLIMLQGDYAADASAAEAQLAQPGAMLIKSRSNAAGADAAKWPDVVQQPREQQQVFDEMHKSLQQLLQQEQQGEPEAAEHLEHDQQQHEASPSPAADRSKPVLGGSPKAAIVTSVNTTKQSKRQSRSKRKAAALDDDAAASAAAQPAGLTPLMQKLEQMKLLKQAKSVQQQEQMHELAVKEEASLVDVRQWLIVGMVALLKKDAADLVERCRTSDPTIVIEAQLQYSVLQRTHQLLSQYVPLPCSWRQLWREADEVSADSNNPDSCQSVGTRAIAASLLQLLDTAAYDSEARVLLPAAAASIAAGRGADGVLGEVSAALKPLRAFFGRQHLQSLLLLAGPAGQQHALAGLLDKMDQEQVTLLEQLQQLQDQLPSQLLQLPPPEQCHDAGAVLGFYQQQLSSAMADTAACSSALSSLQRIGNCLALLHLMSMQQSVQATPVFMQAAPFLGIVGRPITDAAAAAECFEHEGLPMPPLCAGPGAASWQRSCAPGLLMPEIEQLEPTEAARHAHEMQVHKELQQEHAWQQEAEALGLPFDTSLLKPGAELARHRAWQNSHFQKLMLGPDADKVRGPALLLTQAAELRVWKATQAEDYMGPCLERVQKWAVQLQRRLQGLTADVLDAEALPEGSVCTPTGARDSSAAAVTAEAMGQAHTPHSTPMLQDGRLQESEQQSAEEEDVVALAVKRLSSQAELPSPAVTAEVAAIGVHENSLYQQRFSHSPEQRSPHAVDEQQPGVQPGQQQGDLAAAAAAITAADAASKASLSKVTAARIAAQQGEQQFVSYQPDDDYEVALPTPPALKLESCTASPAPLTVRDAAVVPASAGTDELGAASSSSRASSATAKPPNHLTMQDMEAAAHAAAIAASLPNSPEQTGSLANPWEVAGAAAAMLPAGSVAPAHAKLAYRALFDNSQGGNIPAAMDLVAERQLSAGGTSGRLGLAELVGEPLDAVSSVRSDVDPVTQHSADRLWAQGRMQQDPPAGSEGGSAEHADGSEVPSPTRQRPSSRNGAARERTSGGFSKPASPNKLSTGGLDSASEEGSDAASDSDNDPTDSRQAAAAETAVNDVTSMYTSPGSARVTIPRLGLNKISPTSRALDATELAGMAAASSPTRLDSHPIFRSPALEAGRPAALNAARSSRTAEGGAGADDALKTASTQRSLFSEGSDPAEPQQVGTYPEDELLDGTCAELMRVKMERDSYKSEIEMLKNQLRNQDQTIALLSGNFYTPRTTDGGSMSCRYSYVDGSKDSSAGGQHSYPILGDPSSEGSMQLEASSSGKSLAEGAARSTVRANSSQLQGIPEVPSEQLSPEQSDIKQEASKLSIRVQQPSPADSDVDDDSSSTSSSDDSSTANPDSDYNSRGRSARKLKLPEAIPGSSSSTANSAQLAVALSALKFALLLQAANVPERVTENPAGAAANAVSSVVTTPAATPTTSPLNRLKKAALGRASIGLVATEAAHGNAAAPGEQPIKPGDIVGAAAVEGAADSSSANPAQPAAAPGAAGTTAAGDTAAMAAVQHCGGSGRMAGGQYGDGPLLATAVLLQLSGQSRKHALLDATSRIAHWVEYDAVKGSSSAGNSSTASGKGQGLTGGLAPGGIDPSAAGGIAPPQPRSKKRQEEQAEEQARLKQQQAAQQQLLQRLAAAARQADRVAQDGSSIAARFAPAVPAHTELVQLRVYRADAEALAAATAAESADAAQEGTANSNAVAASAAEPSGKWVRFSSGGGGRPRSSNASGAGSAPKHTAITAIPVKSEVVDFAPAVKPWADLVPSDKPIQTHPQLPMPRPRPLLLPDHITAAAFKSIPAGAAGAGGVVNPTGRLVPTAGVTPGAGLVAAARAVHAKEALLAAMPRAAVYSFSVMSDHNRSGKQDDGYSKAPSTADLDSVEDISPRKHRMPQGLAAAAAAGAARLGGRRAGAAADLPAGGTTAQAAGDQWPQSGYSGSEASGSPSKSRSGSPSKRAGTSGLRPFAQQFSV